MKRTHRGKLAGSWIAGLLLAFAGVSAHAANTAANTSITNTASVAYTVNGTAQTAVPSNQAEFVVDAKLVLTVDAQDGQEVSATPGSTTAVTKFLITNGSNSAVTAFPSFVNLATGQDTGFGNNSDFAVTSAKVYLDEGNGTFDGNETEITAGNGLGSDLAISGQTGDSKVVFVVATIPGTATDTQLAAIGLEAAVGKPGAATAMGTDDSANPDVAGTVQYIFAEPVSTHPAGSNDTSANDGVASDRDGYKIVSAALSISKSSAVITDPIVCATAGNAGSCTGGKIPHAIPGAVVEYTISVDNSAGSADATGVTVSDSLVTEIGNGTIAYDPGSINVLAPNLNSGAAFGCPDGSTTNTVTCTFTGNIVSAGSFDVPATKTATVKFRVVIQ